MPGLRALAESDLAITLEDDVGGFGWPITVTAPDGTVGNLVGASNDIGQAIDPDTGVVVSGSFISIALRISSLTAVGLDIPKAIADADIKPWLIQFDDLEANAQKFKVRQSNPDKALGVVSCVLEVYE